MSIVSTTLCYPDRAAPARGIFIERRLRAIHERMPLRIIAPRPWFPFVRRIHPPPPCLPDTAGGPRVCRPRMFYLPGVMKHWDSRFYASALGHALSTLHDEPPVRLIDAHFVWPDGVGAWRVAVERRLRFVCTIRGKLVSQIASRSKRRRIIEMLRGADALIAVCGSLRELAHEVAGRDLGIHVVPNGIDRSVFHRTAARGAGDGGRSANAASRPDEDARAVLGWPPDARHVVSVGHLQALKGFHQLVEAWPEVRRRAGDVRLVLVGGGAGEAGYARRLRARIEAVNRGSSAAGRFAAVTLLGPRPPSAVARLLNAADLFVLASASEGWCNALAEALACGCPAVATDVGGNREIIHDPALGRLVPPGDRGVLVEAVCTALGADWDRDRIAERGGRRDWQQVAAECVDVFRTLLR